MMREMENPSSPISRTMMTVDGQKIELQFTLSDIVRLKLMHGVDLADFGVDKGTKALQNTLALISVAMSRSIQKTPEEIGDMFDFTEIDRMTEIVNSLTLKQSAQAKATENSPTVQ